MQKVSTPQRNRQTKIVLVGGCFDILHFGHVSFLEKAKALGDYLIVALESDTNTRRLKGKGRPIHSAKQRRAMLESLRWVDQVILLPAKPNYHRLVRQIKPAIIAMTAGDPKLKEKRLQAQAVGAKVAILPKVKTPSTTEILTNHPVN